MWNNKCSLILICLSQSYTHTENLCYLPSRKVQLTHYLHIYLQDITTLIVKK